MKQMFQECYNLKYLDLSNFDTSEAIDMRVMFYKCTNLQYLNIQNFKVNNTTDFIFDFINNKTCKLIANNSYLSNKFYSNS